MSDVFMMKQDFLGAGCVDHLATERTTITQTCCNLRSFELRRLNNSRARVAGPGASHRELNKSTRRGAQSDARRVAVSAKGLGCYATIAQNCKLNAAPSFGICKPIEFMNSVLVVP